MKVSSKLTKQACVIILPPSKKYNDDDKLHFTTLLSCFCRIISINLRKFKFYKVLNGPKYLSKVK